MGKKGFKFALLLIVLTSTVTIGFQAGTAPSWLLDWYVSAAENSEHTSAISAAATTGFASKSEDKKDKKKNQCDDDEFKSRNRDCEAYCSGKGKVCGPSPNSNKCFACIDASSALSNIDPKKSCRNIARDMDKLWKVEVELFDSLRRCEESKCEGVCIESPLSNVLQDLPELLSEKQCFVCDDTAQDLEPVVPLVKDTKDGSIWRKK